MTIPASHSPRTGAGRGPGNAGFTLIELMAVLVILAGVMAIVLPRLTGLGGAYMKADAGRVASLLRYVSDAAETRKVPHRLLIDLEEETISVEAASVVGGLEEYSPAGDPAMRRLVLERGVEIADVVTTGLGRVKRGVVEFRFPLGGGSEGLTIHLGPAGGGEGGDGARTIEYNPYSGRVTVAEGYE